MGDSLKVLFVCTANIFRSVGAEYCLKDFLKRKGIKNIIVSSAGTVAHKKPADPKVIHTLKNFGISSEGHKLRKLTKKILEENDVIIAMSTDHQEFIWKNFGRRVNLFHEFSIGKKTPLLDVDEKIKNYERKPQETREYIKEVINHIHKLTPKVLDTINHKYLLFEHFLEGSTYHSNSFRFEPLLYESKYTAAFMSISIPEKEDGHIIVIPKKRYSRLEQIPPQILNGIMKTISIIGKAILLSHEGYNIVLNNGEGAEQTIFHTHFHIIPRDKGDNIRMKVWKNKKMTEEEFHTLNKKFRKSISKVLRRKL